MKKKPVSYPDTTEDESMYSDMPSTSAKPTPGRKRKNPETATKERRVTGRAHAKRAKGNRGILKELVEMPLDVLFEVPRVPFPSRIYIDLATKFDRYLAAWNLLTCCI